MLSTISNGVRREFVRWNEQRFLFRDCPRGGFCNFMHLKPISKDLRKRLYQRRQKKPHTGSRSPSGGGGRSRSRSRDYDRRR